MPATDTTTGVTVVVDTMMFAADGTGRNVRITAFLPDLPSAVADTATWNDPLRLRARHRRYELTYACPPNASCVAGPHMLIYPSSAGFTGVPIYSAPRLYYERIGSPR